MPWAWLQAGPQVHLIFEARPSRKREGREARRGRELRQDGVQPQPDPWEHRSVPWTEEGGPALYTPGGSTKWNFLGGRGARRSHPSGWWFLLGAVLLRRAANTPSSWQTGIQASKGIWEDAKSSLSWALVGTHRGYSHCQEEPIHFSFFLFIPVWDGFM